MTGSTDGLEGQEHIQIRETEDGLKLVFYKIEDRSYIDLDWEEGSRWEFLDSVEPEEIVEKILSILCEAEEQETSDSKWDDAWAMDQASGDE